MGDKLQHEARKPYRCSEVAMRLHLLRKHWNSGTSTRLAKFNCARCLRVCEINPALNFSLQVCRSLNFLESLSLGSFVSLIVWGVRYFLPNIHSVFFNFVVVGLSPLTRKFVGCRPVEN